MQHPQTIARADVTSWRMITPKLLGENCSTCQPERCTSIAASTMLRGKRVWVPSATLAARIC